MMLKSFVVNHFKNIPGWRSNRKFLIFSVDDFGNVRLDSLNSREEMAKAGLKQYSNFDRFDILESGRDLEALYEVLSSVRDVHGNNAIFTPFAVPCNMNFERVIEEGYLKYEYELLPETYRKLEAKYPKIYENSWKIWKEGILSNFLKPQFHGREHLNIETINARLVNGDRELRIAIGNRSLTSLTPRKGETNFSIAFGYQNFEENEELSAIIKEGLDCFERVYGFRSSCFMPPSAIIDSIHHSTLNSLGIKSIDSYLFPKKSINNAIHKSQFRWLGKNVGNMDMIFIIRNCVFEPLQESNALEKCKYMIDAAFSMNKPAIVSSHRMNFVGTISESKRSKSLADLKELLFWVIKKYPEVEFVSLDQVSEIIRKSKNEVSYL